MLGCVEKNWGGERVRGERGAEGGKGWLEQLTTKHFAVKSRHRNLHIVPHSSPGRGKRSWEMCVDLKDTRMEMDKMKQCVHCEERFVSNNKLFQHLVASHGVERDSIHSVRPGKIILLVGWLSQNSSDEEKGWEMDGHLSHAWTINEDRVERELFHAIDQVDGVNISFAELEEQRKTLSSTRGLSRASSCAQRASHLLQIEKTSHSVTDAFCFQIPGKSKPKNQEWIASVNALLPNDIRVIEVYNLPSSYTEFHAEAGCSQRVYEYVLPLRILFPPFMMETGAGGGDEESDHEIKLENRKVKEKVWCKMDAAFPRDTPQALKRIENFRRLKILLKLFCGKNSYHNFITGGASPEDGHVKRRVDRFYHKEMLSILYHKQNNNSSTGRSDGSDEITISDICHDPFYNNTDATGTNQDSSTLSSSSVPVDSPISEDWAVLSLSGNTFLKGQPRRMIGLAIAVMWGWLPLSFIEAALDPQNIVNLPAVPGCGLYLSECRYDKWEAKSEDWRFDPRRVVGADLTSLNNWTRVVQTYAVKSMVRNGFDWMEEMKSQCEIFLLRYETERSLRLRSPEELLRRIESPEGDCCGIPTTLPSEVYNAYETVLRLLREADASGQWPLSSQVRQSLPPSRAVLIPFPSSGKTKDYFRRDIARKRSQGWNL
jgi:tRNA U38,U39,U40 pseudouridine synthase TruA